MYSVTIIFLLVTLLANSTADDGSISTSNYVYIGQPDSERKLFFASISELPWFDGMDNCNVHGFIPGRISDEMQHSFIKNFLQTTTLFPQGPGSLWLPATDHIEEGTFRWLENYGEVNVGTRSEGMPSGNRSANCLLINQDGLYREDSCHAYVPHHVLCEVPLLKYARPEADKTYYSKLGDKLAGVGGPSSIIPTDQSLVKIGRVGNIRYFVDEDPSDTKGWLENWDLCHENAMRLAAPESMEEYYFLRNYSMREEMAGRWNLFHIGASDILSVSCGKGNTYPRWVHNGNAVTSDPNLVDAGHSHRFRYAYLSSDGLSASDCIGSVFRVMCELEEHSVITTPGTGTTQEGDVCRPGDYYAPHQDCQFYWICNPGNPVLRQCPAQLYWNQELMACDYMSNVTECVGGTRPPNI